ncbi:hypothetical protein TVAG_235220 [Trichomonas vaginalis G3]|uniref:Uncharacterized protein n=1 Tax=Trichomonas vaginalis (strain ATCC PRA-98 / G3) TaxID=412133 RepID=A2DPP0_TRIV3|nr:ubiquitin-protein transferase protein [Trichomonas vaginalis G3]EAY17640.1 hypothetical protein TVAG_235220 [Trichomonas vaginalis G3]KAI5486116.1 ubiquitin-protein transferase protein [Trichomonas vaginalis G3]|eukprot:XP_001329775.1 hypothetical protein [Trichomonas vaginalis G3]
MAEWNEPRFSFYKKSEQLTHYYGDNLFPVVASSSDNHFILLTDTNELYTYGESHAQSSDNIINTNNMLKKVDLPEHSRILDISCGNHFSILLHECNSISILTEDSSELVPNPESPRGLSSNLELFAFAAGLSDIYLYESAKSFKKATIPDDKIITTAVTDFGLFVLSIQGKLYYSSTKELQFKPVEINFTTQSIFNLTCGIIAVSADNRVYMIEDNLKVREIIAPYGTHIVEAAFFGFLYCLDATGRVLTANTNSTRPVLMLNSQLSTYNVSCMTASHLALILFRGENPSSPLGIPPPEHTFLNNVDATIDGHKLLLACDSYVFLSNRRVTMNDFTDIIRGGAKIEYGPNSLRIYYTDESRLIGVDTDFKTSFSFNFLPGDVVETDDGQRSTVVGISDDRVWVEPFSNTRLVYCASDPRRLSIVTRKDHNVERLIVDGVAASVDRTPSFCEFLKLGASLGDLLRIPERGACEFIGVLSCRLVMKDFATNSLFSIPSLRLETLRTFVDKDKKRRIVTPDGIVDVSVYSKGMIFQCTDRVLTPMGIGTVIGYKGDKIYVQTDEMRIADIGGAPFSVIDLSLVRRTASVARKTFKLKDGDSILLSVSTDDRVYNLMAGDRVLEHDTRGRIAGVSNKKLYVLRDGKKYVEQIEDAELLFRADINGGECCETYEVGSPALGMSALIPDDVVRFEGDDAMYAFKGIARSGPLFVRRDTLEMFSTSFSALLTPSSYTLIERRAIPKN